MVRIVHTGVKLLLRNLDSLNFWHNYALCLGAIKEEEFTLEKKDKWHQMIENRTRERGIQQYEFAFRCSLY